MSAATGAVSGKYEFFEKMLADLVDQFSDDSPKHTFVAESNVSATADVLTGLVRVENPSPSTERWFTEHTPEKYEVNFATSTRALVVRIAVTLEDADQFQLHERSVGRERVAICAAVAVCMALVLVLVFA